MIWRSIEIKTGVKSKGEGDPEGAPEKLLCAKGEVL